MTFTGELRPYQVKAMQHMVERGRVLVAMEQGCFTGDTLVHVNRFGRGRLERIDHIVHKFLHEDWNDGNTYVRGLKADGQIGRVLLTGAYDVGMRATVQLNVGEHRVYCTPGHEIVTPGGKVPARRLTVGDHVLVDSWRGRQKYPRRTPPRPKSPTHLPDGRKLDDDGYVICRIPEHPRTNKAGYVFEHILVAEWMLRRPLEPGERVHHANEIKHDNRPGNLLVCASQAEHARGHNLRHHLPGVIPDVAPMVGFEDGPFAKVYDLTVADDAHTYIANGIIVGNTGKTPTTIAAIEELNADFDDTLSGLVFAGSALKYQWRDEIARFTGGSVDADGNWSGGASVIVIDGPQEARIKLYRRVHREQPQYVILGYEQLVDDYRYVLSLPRDFMVGDEITAIKSPAAQRAQALKTLDAPFIYGLTGTPLENGKPDEIFSIMEWIDATVLGEPKMFERAFVVRNRNGWITGYRNLPQLHRTLSKAMVRVRRDDPPVAKFMPRKVDPKTHLVKLDRDTAGIYQLIATDLANDLVLAMQQRKGAGFDVFALYTGANNTGDEIQGKIAAKIAALRMLLTHPSVLRHSAERYRDTENAKTRQGSAYAYGLLEAGELDDMPNNSSKFSEAICRIDEVLGAAEGNKVVVFSFFKGALQLLADAYGDEAVQFHGGMNATQKAAAKRRFQYDPEVRLFLSSDAGGYGVDLPQANYLLNIDLPFSKGKTDQRNSRHDRASSLHEEIHTETFLVEGSIEQFYAAKLASKGGVARAIIDGVGYDRKGRLELGAHTLLEWLQTSAV